MPKTPLRRRRDVGESRIEERIAAGERKATSVGDTGESPSASPKSPLRRRRDRGERGMSGSDQKNNLELFSGGTGHEIQNSVYDTMGPHETAVGSVGRGTPKRAGRTIHNPESQSVRRTERALCGA
jgi:hypothetical protein